MHELPYLNLRDNILFRGRVDAEHKEDLKKGSNERKTKGSHYPSAKMH